ncbi:MAG TPA: phosphoribosylglycinamide formyltransferase [Caulobacterales bacterium]|nr:phosphoribosylglycinamide formyltransferase [Caulobacterales bacterium]
MESLKPLRLGFLASHGGSGMAAILRAIRSGALAAEPRVLISNNIEAGAHDVAREHGVPSLVLNAALAGDEAALDRAIERTLADHGVNLVALSGYMRKLGPRVLARFRNRILNVHPALLPAFGGKGMYGDRVHAAVLAAKAKVSGASVHLVDAEYDHGPVVARQEAPVLPGDTIETLRARVQEAEQALFVRVLRDLAAEKIDLDAIGAG